MAFELGDVKELYVLIKNEDLEEIKKVYKACGIEFNIEPRTFNYSYRAVPTKRGKKPKKFNEQQVQKIKQALVEGMSIRKASIEFQCAKETIQKIKNNKY